MFLQYLRNDNYEDHADSRGKSRVTPDPFFTNFWLQVRKKNAESFRSWLRYSGSVATSDVEYDAGGQ